MQTHSSRLPQLLADWGHRRLGVPHRLHVHADIGQGPVIVLLHGIASSSVSWRHVVPLLSQHYRCIMIDLFGFGDSPKPAYNSYTPEEHVKQLYFTIRRLQLNEPFILMGHSLGSLLALQYAHQHPLHVKRLVMLSPPVYTDVLSGPRYTQTATSAYFKIYHYLRTHKNFTITNATRIAKMLPASGLLTLDETTWVPFTRSLEHCIERQAVTDILRTITVPVDIWYGLFDEFIIKSNVTSLAAFPHVALYRAPVRHIISRNYAQALARHYNPL